MIIIKTPFWKTKSIGIAEYKLGMGINEFQITYKKKDGTLMFPGTYVITKEKALTYDSTTTKDNVRLRMIPFSDLELKHK